MARLGVSKKKKNPPATELSQLKKELQRVTDQLESRDRDLEQRNAELCEALDHQTATAEVLQTARFGQSRVVQKARFYMITVSLAFYFTQIYVTKNGFPDGWIRAAQVCAAEIRAAEIRAAEVRSPKVAAAEIRSPEILAAEIRVPTISVAEVRAARVRATEIRAPEVPPRKIYFTGSESD
jgi:hypothetical protein